MKKLIVSILSALLLVLCNSCSSNSDPQLRIRNEQQNKVNVNIQSSENNKFSINDIAPGQMTNYQRVSEGNITAINITQNESISFLAAKNIRYTVVIRTGNPPALHIDQ